jgi:hypothetical protein
MDIILSFKIPYQFDSLTMLHYSFENKFYLAGAFQLIFIGSFRQKESKLTKLAEAIQISNLGTKTYSSHLVFQIFSEQIIFHQKLKSFKRL